MISCKKTVVSLTMCALIALMCVALCTACGSSKAKHADAVKHDSVAATVDGFEIMESDVAYQIQSARAMYGAEDDTSWASMLGSSGMSAADLRKNYIDALIEDHLMEEKAASALNVSVSEEEVDKSVAKMRELYDSDAAWQDALKAAKMTEEEYRDSVRKSLLDKAVDEYFKSQVTVSDEDLNKTVASYAAQYNGAKRSSHILISVSDTTDTSAMDAARAKANEALAAINGGMSFEDAAKQYSDDSSASSGGDVGWDKATTFVQAYQSALDGLSKGQMSGIVESEYGVHIILCTDVLNFGDDTSNVKLSDFPSDLASEIESSAKTQLASDARRAWMDELKSSANIVINDMPSGMPYDVDTSAYASSQSASSSSATSQ